MIEKTTGGLGQDSVSSMVQEILRESAVLANVFWDVSEFAEPGDTSISFPRNTNRFQVQKLSGSQKGDDQEVVIGFDKLDLDQEAHIQWAIKKFDQKKSKVAILENAIENATGEHAISLDEDLRDEFLNNNTITSLTGGITQDNIVDAIVSANLNRLPKANRRWIFGNSGYGALLKIDGFVDASKSNMEIVKTGQIGTLYGVPVFESDVYTADEGAMTYEKAVAYGFQAGPEVESQQAIEYGTGSKRWVMDQLYGVKAMQGGLLGVEIKA